MYIYFNDLANAGHCIAGSGTGNHGSYLRRDMETVQEH